MKLIKSWSLCRMTMKELNLLLKLVLAEGKSYGLSDNWRINYQRASVQNLYKKLSEARKKTR